MKKDKDCTIITENLEMEETQPTLTDLINNGYYLQPKVYKFAVEMQRELNNNSHKGDWQEFTDKKGILSELDYHILKLYIDMDATKENKEDIKERIADCANILLILGNSYGLYDL